MTNKIYIKQNETDKLLNPKNELGLDPNKGILIMGKVGVGKTTLLKQLASLHKSICWGHPKCPTYFYGEFRITKDLNTKLINSLYEKHGRDGLSVLKKYDMFLDDIASEQTFANHFGNIISPVEDVLFDRHAKRKDIKTYSTTNLDLESLKNTYGERMGDRWTEMFNLVIIEGESYRK